MCRVVYRDAIASIGGSAAARGAIKVSLATLFWTVFLLTCFLYIMAILMRELFAKSIVRAEADWMC